MPNPRDSQNCTDKLPRINAPPGCTNNLNSKQSLNKTFQKYKYSLFLVSVSDTVLRAKSRAASVLVRTKAGVSGKLLRLLDY
jgi:hypothetical protein